MMKVVLASVLAMAGVTTSQAEQKPQKIVKRVEAGGMPFKVTIKGDKATVVRRGMFFTIDADLYFAAKEAAEIASGCKVNEGFGGDVGVYYAKLDCSPGRIPISR